MSTATGRPRKTVEDYLALPDDIRAELIGGDIYVTPAPRLQHQRTVQRIWREIDAWARGRAAGEAFLAPVDVHLPCGDVVEPDLVYVSTARRAICQDWIQGVPDLVVEVLSPGHAERDRIVKRGIYERSAVPEYWIVDPDERSVEVLTWAEGRFQPAGWFVAPDRLTSPVLPGLAIDLAEVFP